MTAARHQQCLISGFCHKEQRSSGLLCSVITQQSAVLMAPTKKQLLCSKTTLRYNNLYHHQAEPCTNFDYFWFCTHQTASYHNKALCIMSTEDYSVHYMFAYDTMPHTSIIYHNPPALFGGGRGRYFLHETLYLT